MLASLLSVAAAVAAAADTASVESGQSGETVMRRENAQRRVKKSMMGRDEYVKKDNGRGYGNAPSYNGRSSSVSRKKYKDPKSHGGDRLMFSGKGKGGKGKGKGYTYPPSPRPPATPAP